MDDQYTFENKTYRDTYRHTTSHILAQAMKRLYPEVKLAIGPAIEDGFYYDFDSPQPFKARGRDAQDLQGKAASRAL
jgi:threonyl-tRNA synthetase